MNGGRRHQGRGTPLGDARHRAEAGPRTWREPAPSRRRAQRPRAGAARPAGRACPPPRWAPSGRCSPTNWPGIPCSATVFSGGTSGAGPGKRYPGVTRRPGPVAAYLAERSEEHGHKPATLRAAAAAIAFVHKTAGVADPCARPEVKRTLRSATRKAGRAQKQAAALTTEALAAIQSTACLPRRGRGGRGESSATANSRGTLDMAVIRLMRDAMLRVSEAAALTWQDLMTEADGTGRLLIRRSKTDAEGAGAVAFVSAETMATLGRIRKGAARPRASSACGPTSSPSASSRPRSSRAGGRVQWALAPGGHGAGPGAGGH